VEKRKFPCFFRDSKAVVISPLSYYLHRQCKHNAVYDRQPQAVGETSVGPPLRLPQIPRAMHWYRFLASTFTTWDTACSYRLLCSSPVSVCMFVSTHFSASSFSPAFSSSFSTYSSSSLSARTSLSYVLPLLTVCLMISICPYTCSECKWKLCQRSKSALVALSWPFKRSFHHHHHHNPSQVDTDRPISAFSNSLFKGIPSRLRPFGLKFGTIFGIPLLFLLLTCRNQSDL